MINLTQKMLKDALSFDPKTGIFTWVNPSKYNHMNVGDVAGGDDGIGYIRIRVAGKKYKAHRLAWLYVNGCWPLEFIDHIDGDRSNNAISNLRDVSRSINAQNQKQAHKNKVQGPLGVHWSARHRKWIAKLSLGGERFHSRYFATPELASAAYFEMKEKVHSGYVKEVAVC